MEENFLYIKAFNAGYLIEKYLPQLAKVLTSSLNDSDNEFIQGFLAGTQEYAKERSRGKLISKLRTDFGGKKSNPSKDMDKGKDIDR